jgi:hypothetical protein
MAPTFKSQGLHTAMYAIPALMLLCAASLLGAARTVGADMRKVASRTSAPTEIEPASA